MRTAKEAFDNRGSISRNVIPPDVVAYMERTGLPCGGEELSARVAVHREGARAAGRVLSFEQALNEVAETMTPDEFERANE